MVYQSIGSCVCCFFVCVILNLITSKNPISAMSGLTRLDVRLHKKHRWRGWWGRWGALDKIWKRDLYRHGVVVITTALHSTKPELKFCAVLKPARGMSEIRDGKDLWQWLRLEIRLNVFCRSTIPQKQFIVIIRGLGTLCQICLFELLFMADA